MYDEVIVHTGTKKHKAILQNGFYSPGAQTMRLHKHNYAEIHVVAGSQAQFLIGGKEYTTAEGNLLLIPPDVYHCFLNADENTLHAAFQIDYDAQRFSACFISEQTVCDFLQQIEQCKQTRDYARVSAYLALFCSYFQQPGTVCAQPMSDYGVRIHQFFSAHYSEDIRLEDLAGALNLSARQAERMVIKYTGRTFRDELASIRINTARHLQKTTRMSLSEIAQYVGYRSYAGFWKAMKKQADTENP